MRKVALCTGIGGQVGSYLAEILLEDGWEVHGLRRRKAIDYLENLEKCIQSDKFKLHWGDLNDGARLAEILMEVKPDVVYNFAAQSQVRISFDTPASTGVTTGVSVARLLQLTHRLCPGAKFYQASSSEMYGSTPAPQNEDSPMVPVSPYGAAKLYAYNMVQIFRNSYGMHATNGIVFNCDSPRRGAQFVTRKIAKAVARIHAGKQKKLTLGNLEAKRDWTYALTTAQGIYDLMKLDEPVDVCLGSGETHSVEEFVDEAFKVVGKDWKEYVEFDERLMRPTEVNVLKCDPTKAKELIGWSTPVSFKQLVKLMIEAELASV